MSAAAIAQAALFPAEPTPLADAPPVTPARPRLRVVKRCAPGDLWQLGRHRLLCGDSTVPENAARLMGGARGDACVCDPPYGINYNTKHTRFVVNGSTLQSKPPPFRDYPPVIGDLTPFDPAPLLRYKHLVLWGAMFYAGRLPRGSWLVWDKRHKSGVGILSDGEIAWMRGGRGVYIYAHTWQGCVRDRPTEEPHLHPTQKPIALMEWCLAKCGAGANVYDPYAGSGPVLMACERTGRTAYALEIDPAYCDVIIQRWESATGGKAARLC